MNPLDPNWVQIQHRSFLNWVNSKLKNRNIQLTNLGEGFKTGENLLILLSELTKNEYPLASIRPQYRIQMMNNIAEALNIITKDLNIPLVNIDSNDIVDGNLKLVLAVVYALIYKFQICQVLDQKDLEGNKQNPEALLYIEQLLLQWLNSTLYDNQPVLTNLTSDWTDGEHLKKLILHLTNGQSTTLNDPNWSSFDPVKKLSLCIDQAEHELHIPRIQDAQDLANSPDRFSMIAYLSYFRMVKSENQPQAQQQLENVSTCIISPEETKQATTAAVMQTPVVIEQKDVSASSAPPLEELSNVTTDSQPSSVSAVHVHPPQQMAQYQHHQPKPPQQPIVLNQMPTPPSSQPTNLMDTSSHVSQHYLPQQQLYPNVQQVSTTSSSQSPIHAQLQQQWLPSITTMNSVVTNTYPNMSSHPSSSYLPNSGTCNPTQGPFMTSQPPLSQSTIYPMNMNTTTQMYHQQMMSQPMMMGMQPQPPINPAMSPQNPPPQIMTTTTTTTTGNVFTDMFGNVYSTQLPPQGGPYF
nr:unnamed protein product [Naegleria fowleri]